MDQIPLLLTLSVLSNSAHKAQTFFGLGKGSELVLQGDAGGVHVEGAGQQTDEVDQRPDGAADTGADGENDLDDAVLVIAQIEVVDT